MLAFSSLTEPTGLRNQRYELLGEIGSGGQGVVYRAFDHWTQRPVAIKVLGSRAAREPQAAERLSREQQALTALKGTAAVEVLDIYRGKDGELCLVMELLKGTTLDAYLQEIEARNERMELFRIAEVFEPIVDTLEVAHKAGILHRDLKPANVFLLEDGAVRLLDFGMTRLRTSAPLTAEGTVMGSPSFMAPEAWKGQSAAVDHRADVYSLGVILFRVLAGALPFSGLSLYEKMVGSTKSERPSLHAKRPDLSPDVDEWVLLALAIDREQRFQNVRALWNAFLVEGCRQGEAPGGHCGFRALREPSDHGRSPGDRERAVADHGSASAEHAARAFRADTGAGFRSVRGKDPGASAEGGGIDAGARRRGLQSRAAVVSAGRKNARAQRRRPPRRRHPAGPRARRTHAAGRVARREDITDRHARRRRGAGPPGSEQHGPGGGREEGCRQQATAQAPPRQGTEAPVSLS
jgi:tRNA A-37 threonylcarbamoyl transferase component Bud32